MSQRQGIVSIPEHEDLLISGGDTLVITVDYKRAARENTEKTGFKSLIEHLPVSLGCMKRIQIKMIFWLAYYLGVRRCTNRPYEIDYGEDTEHVTQLLTNMRGIFDGFNIEEQDVEFHLPWYNHHQLHAAIPLFNLKFTGWTLYHISEVSSKDQIIEVKQKGDEIFRHDWLHFDEDNILTVILNSHPSPGREVEFVFCERVF